MGEYGMSYAEARRVPQRELIALWSARERRMARSELRLLDDLFAVAGLQSEVKVEGEKRRKGEKPKKVIPVTLNQRREELRAEGYPTRKRYDPQRDKRKIESFWESGGLDDNAVVVDLAPPDARE